MSKTRTQVYLTESQRRRIDEIAQADGVTLAEIVRRALDRFLIDEIADPTSALKATFGASSDAEAPSRDGWDRG